MNCRTWISGKGAQYFRLYETLPNGWLRHVEGVNALALQDVARLTRNIPNPSGALRMVVMRYW